MPPPIRYYTTGLSLQPANQAASHPVSQHVMHRQAGRQAVRQAVASQPSSIYISVSRLVGLFVTRSLVHWLAGRQ